jgi:hypothetical protein
MYFHLSSFQICIRVFIAQCVQYLRLMLSTAIGLARNVAPEAAGSHELPAQEESAFTFLVRNLFI